MKTHYLLVVVSCFLHFSSQSQENKKLDSLILLYNEQVNDTTKVHFGDLICAEQLYKVPNDVLKYAQEMVEVSEQIGFKKGIAKGNFWLGGYFLARDDIQNAEQHHKKAHHVFTEINNLSGILSVNTQLGNLSIRKGDLSAAIQHLTKNINLFKNKDSIPNVKESDFKYIGSTFHTLSSVYNQKGQNNIALNYELKALDLYKENGEELYIADALNSLGSIESNLGNLEESIVYYEEALTIYQKHNDIYFELLVLHNLGLIERRFDNYQKSEDYFKQAIEIAKENGFTGREGSAWNGLGTVNILKGKNQVAIDNLNQSIKTFKTMDHPTEIQAPYSNLGAAYNNLENPKMAITYLNKAIKISDSLESIKTLAISHLERSKSYQKLGEYDRALEDFKKHSILNDSMFNETKSRQIEEMRTIFETEKKEQQIVIQQNKIAFLEQETKIGRLQQILLSGGLGLSILILGFAFYGIRQKMKRTKLEKEKVDSELAFKKKELTTHALHLAKKNEVLESIKQKAKELKLSEQSPGYSQLIKTINFDQQDDKSWENFTQYFEKVHKNFPSNVRAKYPDVTKNELRFMALLKMNMSSKEIATILNITNDGVKKVRQRLRKKMNLTPEDSLENTVLDI